MAVTREEIIEALKEMSLLEASELVKDIEETFGVSAAAPVAVAAAPAAGGEAGGADEKSEFDVVLVEAGAKHVSLVSLLQPLCPFSFPESDEHEILADKQRTLHQHTVR